MSVVFTRTGTSFTFLVWDRDGLTHLSNSNATICGLDLSHERFTRSIIHPITYTVTCIPCQTWTEVKRTG